MVQIRFYRSNREYIIISFKIVTSYSNKQRQQKVKVKVNGERERERGAFGRHKTETDLTIIQAVKINKIFVLNLHYVWQLKNYNITFTQIHQQSRTLP